MHSFRVAKAPKNVGPRIEIAQKHEISIGSEKRFKSSKEESAVIRLQRIIRVLWVALLSVLFWAMK